MSKIVSDLYQKKTTTIDVHGFDVHISLVGNKRSLALQTQIYFGDNYIPGSVRKASREKPFFDSSWIHTYVTCDESLFALYLNYKGTTANIPPQDLKDIVDEFCWLADEWRLLLEEEDRGDRVYVKG